MTRACESGRAAGNMRQFVQMGEIGEAVFRAWLWQTRVLKDKVDAREKPRSTDDDDDKISAGASKSSTRCVVNRCSVLGHDSAHAICETGMLACVLRGLVKDREVCMSCSHSWARACTRYLSVAEFRCLSGPCFRTGAKLPACARTQA
jgi:hypothetical protein